jgi:hypothetical protein
VLCGGRQTVDCGVCVVHAEMRVETNDRKVEVEEPKIVELDLTGLRNGPVTCPSKYCREFDILLTVYHYVSQ